MSGRTKVLSVSTLVLLLIVCSLLVTRTNVSAVIHREIETPTQTVTQTPTPPVSFNLPTSIKEISISDGTGASMWWIPNNQKFVSSQVLSWLKEATPYTEKIPQSPEVVFQGNVGPARITLTTADHHLIEIYPEYYVEKSGKSYTSISTDGHGVVTKTENPVYQVQYVQDVLVFNNGVDRTYLESEPLYNWLKQGQWKPEFVRK